jgi:hypothetical protein
MCCKIFSQAFIRKTHDFHRCGNNVEKDANLAPFAKGLAPAHAL